MSNLSKNRFNPVADCNYFGIDSKRLKIQQEHICNFTRTLKLVVFVASQKFKLEKIEWIFAWFLAFSSLSFRLDKMLKPI